MAFSQANLENPDLKPEDMPSFEDSKNVSDDVRGTYSIASLSELQG
jgi:hypothetical protein